MSTGNYDYDNFVRVDCALPPAEFWINAVHETAHFTLIKQTTYGLLCFFLNQDARDARSPLKHTLRTLEQAFECVNECYARTKELLLCTEYAAAPRKVQKLILEKQRSQPYYTRYHMERVEPLLLHHPCVSQSKLFPDLLFLMAANVELAPMLETDLKDAQEVQTLILTYPERLYPDHRLKLLLEAYMRLLRRFPAEKVDERLLAEESGVTSFSQSPGTMRQLFLDMERAFTSYPTLKALLAGNIERLDEAGYPPLTEETLANSYRLSLSDCVIPSVLHSRFRILQPEPPVFRPERNVLTIFMEPEMLATPELLQSIPLPVGPRSAFLRITDTNAGINYDNAFAGDLAEFRDLLDRYDGTVYLYLDDYSRYHIQGGYRSMPVFFRADVPWDGLDAELLQQGAEIERLFLQKYSESVFFFFGFDRIGNVIFSMLAYWEVQKVHDAMQGGAYLRCGESDADCFGIHGWQAFRDLIAAVTEDSQYGRQDRASFGQLRIL